MTSKTERQASDFTPGTPNAINGATSSTAYEIADLGLSAGSYMALRAGTQQVGPLIHGRTGEHLNGSIRLNV